MINLLSHRACIFSQHNLRICALGLSNNLYIGSKTDALANRSPLTSIELLGEFGRQQRIIEVERHDSEIRQPQVA